MIASAKIYLLLLLVAAGVVGGPELMERNLRGFSRKDLTRFNRLAMSDFVEQDRRVLDGVITAEDPAYVLAFRRVADARREIQIRHTQVVAVLLAFLVSLVFFLRTWRPARRRRLARVSGGMIERLDDETKAIDENELVSELSRLVGSKRTAIGHIASGPAMKCGYCGARLAFARLGRIRKRVLMKRVPAGTQDKHIKLGDGWWWQRLGPESCAKCGTNDPQPAGF